MFFNVVRESDDPYLIVVSFSIVSPTILSVSLQPALEEFKCGLRPNDGGKVIPDGRRGIGETSIDDGWSMYRLVKMNCGGWTNWEYGGGEWVGWDREGWMLLEYDIKEILNMMRRCIGN